MIVPIKVAGKIIWTRNGAVPGAGAEDSAILKQTIAAYPRRRLTIVVPDDDLVTNNN